MGAKRHELRVHMPPQMLEALDLAARRQFSNVSVYARQVLAARLVADGQLAVDAGDVTEPRLRSVSSRQPNGAR